MKNSSTTDLRMPTASKIWAPRYDLKVEMPIFDITFTTPFSTALLKL